MVATSAADIAGGNVGGGNHYGGWNGQGGVWDILNPDPEHFADLRPADRRTQLRARRCNIAASQNCSRCTNCGSAQSRSCTPETPCAFHRNSAEGNKCEHSFTNSGNCRVCALGCGFVNSSRTCGDWSVLCGNCTNRGVGNCTHALHNLPPWVRISNATCSTPGVEVRRCPGCGDVQPGDAHNRQLHMLPHSEQIAIVTPATCTTQGIRNVICRRSGCAHSAPAEPTPALGHNWQRTSADATAATCTISGTHTYVCRRCGESETRAVDPLGHRWSSLFAVTTPATCTTLGREQQFCTRSGCGIPNLDSGRDVPALGCNLGSWDTTTIATCASAGERARVCARGCENTITEVIPMLEHKFDEDTDCRRCTLCNTDVRSATCGGQCFRCR
jgi:hypothetical protein